MPFKIAVLKRHIAKVRMLIDKRAKTNALVDDLGSALQAAACEGNVQAMELLLAMNNVDPDRKDKDGWTPLSYAAANGHEVVVELLLAKNDVDLNSKDKNNQTPLSLAARNGHEVVVSLLLTKDGVDPDSKDKTGRTLLSWAIESGYNTVIRFSLVKGDDDPNINNRYIQTPLLLAAEKRYETIVRLLLAKHGVNPNSKDQHGQTPLFLAAEKGYEKMVRLLLAQPGIESDSKDHHGRTPLLVASENGHQTVIKLLLGKDGVDPDSNDTSYDQAPLSCVETSRHKAVVEQRTKFSDSAPEKTFSSNGEGFADLRSHLVTAHCSTEPHLLQDRQEIELSAEWELPQAMTLYRKGTQLSSVVVITGKENDAQAATCGMYLEEHFSIGPTLLHALQAAWDSKRKSYSSEINEGNLQHLSVSLHGSECQRAVIAARGLPTALTEVACAFAWFCCALRPSPSEDFGLSTFQFSFHGRRNQSLQSDMVKLELLPPRKAARDEEVCWHNLFNSSIIVLDGPIRDRTQLVQSEANTKNVRMPKGLEIPFEIMVGVAAVGYPFEFDRGIVLKGFSTLLVATAKWVVANSVVAVQWHFVDSKEDVLLSKYTDDERYYIWDEGEMPPPELETVNGDTRTFIGWCDTSHIQLGMVEPSEDLAVTELNKLGRRSR